MYVLPVIESVDFGMSRLHGLECADTSPPMDLLNFGLTAHPHLPKAKVAARNALRQTRRATFYCWTVFNVVGEPDDSRSGCTILFFFAGQQVGNAVS